MVDFVHVLRSRAEERCETDPNICVNLTVHCWPLCGRQCPARYASVAARGSLLPEQPVLERGDGQGDAGGDEGPEGLEAGDGPRCVTRSVAECRPLPPSCAPPVLRGAQDGKMGRLSPEHSWSYVVRHLAPPRRGAQDGGGEDRRQRAVDSGQWTVDSGQN